MTDTTEVSVELFEFSVVIVAEVNNPSILNTDFLRHNGIVSERWGISAERPPITTPVLSEVTFDGGLVIRADPNRVTFQQSLRQRACWRVVDCERVLPAGGFESR